MKPDGSRYTVLVRSPSVLRETGGVIRAVVHIVFWSAAIMGARVGPAERVDIVDREHGRDGVDEIAFRELDPADQRDVSRSLEGLTEAEDARSRDRRVADRRSAREARRAAVRRRSARQGRLSLAAAARRDASSTIVGIPDPASKRPTLRDRRSSSPIPGTPIDPQAVVDETHHKLRRRHRASRVGVDRLAHADRAGGDARLRRRLAPHHDGHP